jgi:carbon-monoxide dehydrogenase medium subunit
MKPAPYEYSRPATVDEACAMLAAEDGARVIAGGQTLVPLMAMRLARPTRLVDIGRLTELTFVRGDKWAIVIGAVTRQCVVERDPRVAAHVPLLAKAMPWIGHAATRARGTIGGSLANADPAAELSLVALTLDAILHCSDGTGIPASAFFVGPMMTALPDQALLLDVLFPGWEGSVGTSLHEVSARQSDFAFAAAAAQLALDDDGVCTRLAVGVGAVADRPYRLTRAEQALVGSRIDPSSVRGAVHDAIAEIETWSDLHASAAYRRRAAVTLATRAILDAHAEATQRAGHAH